MTLKELHNNIDIVLKPFDNKNLNPIQQHAKDTLIGCKAMVIKLCDVIEEKDEQLTINYEAYTKQAIDVKRLERKVMDLENELRLLKKDNKDLQYQNDKFKENLEI